MFVFLREHGITGFLPYFVYLQFVSYNVNCRVIYSVFRMDIYYKYNTNINTLAYFTITTKAAGSQVLKCTCTNTFHLRNMDNVTGVTGLFEINKKSVDSLLGEQI